MRTPFAYYLGHTRLIYDFAKQAVFHNEWLKFLTNIYETSDRVTDSYNMDGHVICKREELMTLRRVMAEGKNLLKSNKEADTESGIIELRAVEVCHFLNKWYLMCNKDKLVVTTDIT